MRVLALAVALALLAGCSSLRARRPIAVPQEDRIYVSVFVDESARGEVGVPLADAMRVEIYRRDPSRLAITFEEGAVAVDGTVHSVKEAPAGEGRLRLVVSAGARLVDREGDVVAELGSVQAAGEYRTDRERAATEDARMHALQVAVQGVARELIRRVDDAGRRTRSQDAGDA